MNTFSTPIGLKQKQINPFLSLLFAQYDYAALNVCYCNILVNLNNPNKVIEVLNNAPKQAMSGIDSYNPFYLLFNGLDDHKYDMLFNDIIKQMPAMIIVMPIRFIRSWLSHIDIVQNEDGFMVKPIEDDVVKQAEPIKQAEPVKPIEAIKPIKQAEPVKPVESIKVQTTEIKQITIAKQTKKTEPSKDVESDKPIKIEINPKNAWGKTISWSDQVINEERKTKSSISVTKNNYGLVELNESSNDKFRNMLKEPKA
jgi:hypothetical protein